MSLRNEVEGIIRAVVGMSGDLRGQIVCPKCRGTVEWMYNGNDLNFWCNSEGCVFSSEAVRQAVLKTIVEIDAPDVVTRRRSAKVMKKGEADYRLAEFKRKQMEQAAHDLHDGRWAQADEPDYWMPQNEHERTELLQSAFRGLDTGESKFGPVFEKTMTRKEGLLLKQRPVEVRRIVFRGKKTPFCVSREEYERDKRWVAQFGPWPQIIYVDHLENSVGLGWVEQPY